MKTTLPQLEIDTEAAKLDIKQGQGRLEIDMYPFRASYGMKNRTDLTREVAERGRDTALDTIGRIAANGDRLAHIATREDAAVNIAAEESLPRDGELTWTRLENPVINYTPQKPQITVFSGKLDINLKRGNIQTDYTPGKISLRMLQYPAVHYSTTEAKVNLLA